MGRRKTVRGAVADRDPMAIYWALLDGLAESFDKTECTRDRAQLANRIMDATDRLLELGEMGAAGAEAATEEASAFEVIAGKRESRRQAAEG